MKFTQFAYIFLLVSGLAAFSSLASATTPVVTITSPTSGSQDGSPVNFTASASSPDCSAGISAMRIYPSPGDAAYTVDSNQLDVNINLTTGSYSAVVQAWDNCGGVGKTTVTFTVVDTNFPAPKFLYSTQYSAGKVGGYVVNEQSGALTPTGQAPVWAHWGPTRIASDYGGYRLYVANQGSQDVSAYFINRSNGYLTPVPGANFPVGGVSSDIVVSPSNKFVYVSTSNYWDGVSGGSNTISAFSVASNGSLVPVPGSPFLTPDQNYALAIDPKGKYLYTTGAVSGANYPGQIYAYSINQTTGAIAQLPGSPYTIVPYNCSNCIGSENFKDLTIDRNGQYLIGPGVLNGVIYVYRIDSNTGALTSVPGSPFVDDLPCGAGCPGAGPVSVTVTGNNGFVYVQNTYDNDIVAYELNAVTGALTLESRIYPPYGTFVLDDDCIRADSSGSFVYALGYDDSQGSFRGEIMGYAITQSNGSVTPVPGAPFADNGGSVNGSDDGIAVTR